MRTRLKRVLAIRTVVVLGSVGCATKKYARNRINERVRRSNTRTGELEETSRRNTQDIGRVGEDITEVRGRRTARRLKRMQHSVAPMKPTSARVSPSSRSPMRSNRTVRASEHGNGQFKFDSYELTPTQSRRSTSSPPDKGRNNFILEVTSLRIDGSGITIISSRKSEPTRSAESCRATQCPVSRMHMPGLWRVRAVARISRVKGARRIVGSRFAC